MVTTHHDWKELISMCWKSKCGFGRNQTCVLDLRHCASTFMNKNVFLFIEEYILHRVDKMTELSHASEILWLSVEAKEVGG